VIDLSRSESGFSHRQSEVFRYRSKHDPVDIACRVINVLGDEFDLFVFHNEFRVDSQESGTPKCVRISATLARREAESIGTSAYLAVGDGRMGSARLDEVR
jgi:hypothetical protein